MKVLFVWPNKDSFGFKPIGLSLLSAIARCQGHETKLFDTTEIDLGYVDNTMSGQSAKIFKPVNLSAYDLEKKKIDLDLSFQKVIKDFNPDCLALTVLSDEFMVADRITRLAKKLNPGLTVIWGGKYTTLNPLKVLQLHNADFVCIAEGLDAFNDFLKALPKREGLYKIPNIWAKNNGKIIKNPHRPLKTNLDNLPFLDWDIFDQRQFIKPFDGKAYISGDHMSNWGCPYHCTYCINHFYHKLYNNKYFMRRFSIARFIEELKYLKNKYKLEFFKFHDEDFLMRPIENLRELSAAYKSEINIPFVIETNPRSVVEEKVRLLKEMNCVSASVAIESGDLQVRNSLLNRVDLEEDVLRAFSLFRDMEIRTSSFNLLGIPFESRETYTRTVELNRKAKVQYPNIGFFYPFEGTVLREISIKNKFFDPDDKESIVYRHNRPALHFNNLSEKELIEMRNVFVLYVKLPKIYWPFIKMSEKLDDLGLKLRSKLLEFYTKTVWSNNGWYIDDGLKNDYLTELNRLCISHKKQILRTERVCGH